MTQTRADLFDAIRPFANGYRKSETIGLVNQLADHLGLPPEIKAEPIPGGLATAVGAGASIAASAAGGAPGLPGGYITPAELIRGFIGAHEGGLSLDPKDHGNHFEGQLIGSKYGVTGAALAAYRKRNGIQTPVNKQTMAELTLEEAVDVGVQGYYAAPGFGQLPWNRVTMSVVDMGWGAGPRQAIKLLQRMIGATQDGDIGPATAAAYAAFLEEHGEEETARRYGAVRDRFYDALNQPRFTKGWKNRTASFLPGTPWWKGAKR